MYHPIYFLANPYKEKKIEEWLKAPGAISFLYSDLRQTFTLA